MKNEQKKVPLRANTSSRLRRGASGLEVNRPGHRPRRSRRLRFRRLLWLIVCALVIVLMAEAAFALFTSYRFNLKEVRVEGADAGSVPLILQQAPAVPGGNIFSLRTGKIARRIKALSFVETVKIKRRPPNALLVVVSERKPTAYFRQGEKIILLDRSGLAFTHPQPDLKALTKLQGLEASGNVIGRRIGGTKAAILLKGLSAFAQNPDMKVKALMIDAQGWLTAQLTSGVQLRLGPAEQLEEKLSLAQTALSRLGSLRPAEYLDLSAPEAVVWKPLKEKT